MYTWIPLATIGDLDRLTTFLSHEYDPSRVVKKLQGGISNAVKAVLIEHRYVDKDYRSTYYNFYAKKGQHYNPDCVRLHFFDGSVRFESETLRLSCPTDSLSNHYFGYMVLRPTGIATIGRSVLSPNIRKGAVGQTIQAAHKVHLLGYKLIVEGFPSMDQHVDISVCAHAACWSILRHYSERYNVYREFLTHDITIMAQQFNPGGLVPSKGLEVSHAERVFQEAGTFPVHVARKTEDNDDDPKDLSFYRQLIAYVDSGFPLFAAMHERSHAVAVIGHNWRTSKKPGLSRLRYAWDQVESLEVVDDGHLPYLRVPVDEKLPYRAHAIDAFIVALPEKIYYPADAVDRMATALFKLGKVIGLPPLKKTIIRYFITTGSSLRHFVREHQSEFDSRLLDKFMTLSFAQFVWVVEFATQEQWDQRRVAARAIIDATASLYEPAPFWLIHGVTNALVFDREDLELAPKDRVKSLTIRSAASGFSRMDQNLRPIQSK